eukprot:15327675-Ditylum_brightwellii.AAC.2
MPMHLDDTEQCLYVQNADCYYQYSQSTCNPRVYEQGLSVTWTPTDLSYPVHAMSIDGSDTWICQCHHTMPLPPEPPLVTNFASYLDALKDWTMQFLRVSTYLNLSMCLHNIVPDFHHIY